jgi:integrase
LRAALRFAVRRGDIDHDPMHLVGLPPSGKSRDRVLTDGELTQVWASDVPVWSRLARVLLLTALRLREAANAPATEVTQDFWQIPSSRMKGNRPHVIPIIPTLRAELGDTTDAKWLFRSPRRFDQPASGFYRGIEAIQRRTNTGEWTWHDLRRTAASGLQRIGAPSEVIEAILAHRRPGVSAVYQRHEYLTERRDWLQKWSERLG